MSVTFEAIVVFPDALPAPAMLRVPTSRPAQFDGVAVACSPDLLSSYLADPGQPVTEAEYERVAGARWGLRLVSRSVDRPSQLAHLVELAKTLLHRGACAVAVPAAMRLFGAAHLEQALAEATDAERWASLFVHHHASRKASGYGYTRMGWSISGYPTSNASSTWIAPARRIVSCAL